MVSHGASPTGTGTDPAGPAYPVAVTVPVLWGHMDALGHVNNTVFFRFFECARIAYFERVALQCTHAPGAAMPILASTRCDFLLPLRHPDEVVARARVTRVGRTSFTMEYVLESHALGAVAARGEGTIVMVDTASGKPVPVDKTLRNAIAAVEGTPPEA